MFLKRRNLGWVRVEVLLQHFVLVMILADYGVCVHLNGAIFYKWANCPGHLPKRC